jgi:hypothetical protein
VIVALLFALSACAAESPPVRVDELAYLRELQTRRPGLMREHSGRVDDPAWQALVIAPEYRSAILEQSYATYLGVLAAEYSPDERKRDETWAAESLSFVRSMQPTDALAPQTTKDIYVGFTIGQYRTIGDSAGFVYKSFFGFTDFLTALAPDAYRSLSATMGERGFHGASKIDLRPSATRFRYNQLVVYSASPAMAACAEAIVASVYGAQLAHVARGVDAPASLTDGRAIDWHHFLLTGRYVNLPSAVRDYVEFRTTPAAACP